MSNLRIAVAASALGNSAGEIYGKVVEADAGTPDLARVRFTLVT
jgi:hypothetical protein